MLLFEHIWVKVLVACSVDDIARFLVDIEDIQVLIDLNHTTVQAVFPDIRRDITYGVGVVFQISARVASLPYVYLQVLFL